MIRNLITQFERNGSVSDHSGRGPKRTDPSPSTCHRSPPQKHCQQIASKDSESGFKNVSIHDSNVPNFITPKL